MTLEMKYFVLKPRAKTAEDPYAIASHAAMYAYADAIENTDSELATELRQWANRETAMMGQTRKTGD